MSKKKTRQRSKVRKSDPSFKELLPLINSSYFDEATDPLQRAYDRCAGLYASARMRVLPLEDGKHFLVGCVYSTAQVAKVNNGKERKMLIVDRLKRHSGQSNRLAEDELDALYRKGIELLEQNKIEEGIKLLLDCADAGYQRAYADIGAIALAYDKNCDVAKSWFQGVESINAFSGPAAYAYGLLLNFKSKDYNNALKYLNHACALHIWTACYMASFVNDFNSCGKTEKFYPQQSSGRGLTELCLVAGHHMNHWFGENNSSPVMLCQYNDDDQKMR